MAESIKNRLPPAFPSEGDFSEWLAAHQNEVNRLESDFEAVKKSMQIVFASGEDLDAIGNDYGKLGRRRERSDDSYRQFLQSLVWAYGGRGTIGDIKLAVTAGIQADTDDVEITEDFSALEYSITILGGAWQTHDSSTIRELAELADPVGVTLKDLEYQIESGIARGVGSNTTSSTLGTERLSSSEMANLSETSGSTIY